MRWIEHGNEIGTQYVNSNYIWYVFRLSIVGVDSQIKFLLLIENRKEQIETWPPLIKSIPSNKVFRKLGSIYNRSNTPMCQLNNAKNFSVMQGRTQSSAN